MVMERDSGGKLHAPMGPFDICYRSGQQRIAWVEQFKQEKDIAGY